jgi:hypothetical protein
VTPVGDLVVVRVGDLVVVREAAAWSVWGGGDLLGDPAR